MSVIWQAPTPITVIQTDNPVDGSGFGTFSVLAPVPGSNRLNNQSFRLHASGSINGNDNPVGFSVFGRYPSVLSAAQYPVAAISHIVGSGTAATLTVPGATFVVGQVVNIAGALQKDIATITNVALTSNVVTVDADNDFAVGDRCVVAAVTNTDINGTFTLTGADPSTFTYAKVHANIVSGADTGSASVPSKINTIPYPAGQPVAIVAVANSGLVTSTVSFDSTSHYASHSEVGTVTIADQPVFDTTTQATTGTVPWSLDVALQIDATSGLMQGVGSSLIDNLYQSPAAISAALVGINPALEPALFLGIHIYFDTSCSTNTATLTNLSLVEG